MISEAIILAGGKGTRLQGIVSDVPKPMATVSGKPFLEHLIGFLAKQGVEKIIFSVGYKAEVIKEYFKEEYFGLKLEYVFEKEPLGTGGGLALAMEKVNGESTFVLNGDTLSMVSLESLSRFHSSVSADVTMVTKYMEDASRYGTIQLSSEGIIEDFQEKKKKEGFINTGVYSITKRWFSETKPSAQKFSFEKDMMEVSLRKGAIYGFPFEGYFIDIGIPEDYDKAQKEISLLK